MELSDIQFSTLPAKQGVLGLIVLNRPRSLNALSFEMLTAMQRQLALWQKDDEVMAIVIKSACSRAFCAGGDVRSLYEDRLHLISLRYFELVLIIGVSYTEPLILSKVLPSNVQPPKFINCFA